MLNNITYLFFSVDKASYLNVNRAIYLTQFRKSIYFITDKVAHR